MTVTLVFGIQQSLSWDPRRVYILIEILSQDVSPEPISQKASFVGNCVLETFIAMRVRNPQSFEFSFSVTFLKVKSTMDNIVSHYRSCLLLWFLGVSPCRYFIQNINKTKSLIILEMGLLKLLAILSVIVCCSCVVDRTYYIYLGLDISATQE